MKKFKAVLSDVSIRKSIAILLTVLFMVLSLMGRVDGVQVSTIYGMIIGFYFGNKTALDVPPTFEDNREV